VRGANVRASPLGGRDPRLGIRIFYCTDIKGQFFQPDNEELPPPPSLSPPGEQETSWKSEMRTDAFLAEAKARDFSKQPGFAVCVFRRRPDVCRAASIHLGARGPPPDIISLRRRPVAFAEKPQIAA